MPQGIAINHLNTPRRIPQAALHKVQLSGQAGLQSVYNVRSDLFLNCLERVSNSLDPDQARQHVIPLIIFFCKAYQQTTQTG